MGRKPGRAPEAVTMRTLAQAVALYDSLADELAQAVEAFRDRGALTEEQTANLRSLQKSLMMVLDFASQLSRNRSVGADAPHRTLDLDAARAEVARRLVRLAAAGEM
jgi:hypothetical protein